MRLKVSVFLILSIVLSACESDENAQNVSASTVAAPIERIVSLSGTITETIFALGHGDKLVGIDVTSTYPQAAVKELAQLGHVRNLNIEGILSLRPDLILIEQKDAGNPVIGQLKQSQVEVMEIPLDYSIDAPVQIAQQLSEKLGGAEMVQAIQEKIAQEKVQLEALTKASSLPKVLFIYARGTGSMMVAGQNTSADAMIRLTGGTNAATSFEGFKALSPEGLVEAQPDVLLLFESGLQSLGGIEQLLEVPGVQQTPAGLNQRIIAMDGLYLLGFTPRVGEAALELAGKLKNTVL